LQVYIIHCNILEIYNQGFHFNFLI
jgi:hypothetical protein